MNSPALLRDLLDTNIVIYVIKRRPLAALDTFNRHHGRKKAATRRAASVSPRTSPAYGQIRALLERRGAPIGINDLHIAGHARSRGPTVVSNNEREFRRVDGLNMENWVVECCTDLRRIDSAIDHK